MGACSGGDGAGIPTANARMIARVPRSSSMTPDLTTACDPSAPHPARTAHTRWVLIGSASILALVIAAYWPAMRGGFLWDDDLYVQHNPLLKSLAGLARIWFEPGATPQYYPLVFTTFWLEWQCWGADPLGYHLVNCILHALNAILLWRVLDRLQVPYPWFAAVVFALHPVHVESVAWISERKNVLSAAFYLGATWTYLRLTANAESRNAESRNTETLKETAAAREGGDRYGSAAWLYLAAWVLFTLSLLSKSVACTWPAAMGLVLWWKRGRIGWADVMRLTPMLVAGAASGLWTAWVEKRYVGAEGATWSLNAAEHLLLAGRILCFYAGKLLWPDPLMAIYPRWEIDAGDGGQWVYPLLCIAALGGLFALRQRTGRGPLAAALFFAGSLFPALGLFNVYFMRFSFVADHFVYLASIGVIAPLVGGIRRSPSVRMVRLVQGALIVVLGINTWAHATTFISANVVWSDTLSKNPGAWLAHNNLGVILEKEGRTDEAEAHFRAALALHHDMSRVHGNLGSLLADRGEFDEAMVHLGEALRLAPESFDAHFNMATGLSLQGRWREAADEYHTAIRLRLRHADAHFGLGTALWKLGGAAGAEREWRDALQIQPDHSGALRALSELGPSQP